MKGKDIWAKPMPSNIAVTPCQFTILCLSLGIEDTDIAMLLRSIKVRQFARSHYRTRFVPELLLKAMNLDPTTDTLF